MQNVDVVGKSKCLGILKASVDFRERGERDLAAWDKALYFMQKVQLRN